MGAGVLLSVDELLSELLCELDGADVSEDELVLSLLVDEFVELVELVESTEPSLCPPPAVKGEPPFSEQPAKHVSASITAIAEIILFFILIPPLYGSVTLPRNTICSSSLS